MSDNLKSRVVTQGVQRSPNRAMLRAVGFGDEDFTKPIIGIANSHSTITPCNMGINKLATRAETGVREAGGMPQMFGTITISDGISMGTSGMRFSLPSRDLIADSIETVASAQWYDAVIAVVGCDKNMPGAMMALGRLNRPAILMYGGTIKPGCLADQKLDLVSAFEAYGRQVKGELSRKEVKAIKEKHNFNFPSQTSILRCVVT